MIRLNLAAAAALGLSAAACSYTSHTTETQPATVPVRTMTGSEQACLDRGFTPGTLAYSNCVSREAEARARGQASTTVVYVPSPPPPPAPVYVETRTTGVEAFRDEYGYRYDAQGNRLDARGNIISPHSKVR